MATRAPSRGESELSALVHTLEVHQAELEAQNEELRAMLEELQRTNDALGVARDRYRALYERAPTPFVTVAPSGTILDANAAAHALLERAPAPLVGAVMETFVDDFWRRPFRTFLAEVFARGHARSPDLVLAGGSDDGKPRVEVLIDGVVLKAGADEERHGVLAVVDITGRRAMEQARRKAQDEVLAVVSHDLRGPLNAIVLACDALRSELSDDERAEFVTTIEKSATRSVRLLKDLLQVVHVDSGTLVLNRTWFDLGELARALCSDHAVAAAAVGCPLACEVEPRELVMYGDHDRLYQVGANLLMNAFVHARGASVEVSVRDGGDVLLFAVADDGPGIAPADHERVFDRFRQGGRGRAGAGLGLAIVKGLVSAHGGSVQLESQPGVGARFELRLPRGARS